MSSERISRSDFRQATTGHELNTRDAALDPRLAGAGLPHADTNGDGVIRGEQELDELFDRLIRSRTRRPRGSASRTMLAALAAHMNAPGLRAMIRRPERAQHEAIVVLGLNDASAAEVAALRRRADVLYVGDLASRQDLIEVAGEVFDLAVPAQLKRFVDSLSLIPEQRNKLTALLRDATPHARRELGELMRIWSVAEAGGTMPARLMLSAHGDHRSLIGEEPGERINDADIMKLARIMPTAAGQIRSLHLAACQHGYEPRMAPFLAVFPNLDSVWGYSGFSPTGRPAQRHQAIWERATHSLPEGGGRLRRSMAHGTRRGEAVSVWTRAHGFEGPKQRELHNLGVETAALRPLYADLLAGRVEINDLRQRDLTRFYDLLQQVTAHSDYPEQTDQFREDHARMRGAALRLRFYPSVASHFARAHAAAIRRGYGALGLTPPDFANMTRPEAMRAIGELGAQVDENSPTAARTLLRLLRHGLGELREREIPTEWIEGR